MPGAGGLISQIPTMKSLTQVGAAEEVIVVGRDK
jgi:hypothetical protein